MDGIEGLTIENASKTLSDTRLKILIIEISENISYGMIEKKIESYGFKVLEKEEYPSKKHEVTYNLLYKRNK